MATNTPLGTIPGCGYALAPGVRVADASHWWGQDVQLTASGDIATCDGIPRSNQRIFRRMCTNGSKSGAKIGEYFFHPGYGGSAPWYVGQTTEALLLEGVLRQQMYAEDSVGHSPEPIISTVFSPNGAYSTRIQYAFEDSSQLLPPLQMDVSGF